MSKINKPPSKILKNWSSEFIRIAFLQAERKRLKLVFKNIDKERK